MNAGEAPSAQQVATAQEICQQEYLGMAFILKSDPTRYKALQHTIENEYTRNINTYPRTLTEAYDILTNYKPIGDSERTSTLDEGGLAFVNHGQDVVKNGGCGSKNGHDSGNEGHGHNQKSHYSKQPDESTHHQNREEDDAQFLVDNVDNLDYDYNYNYSAFSCSETRLAMCMHQMKPNLPDGWLPLDSCSTVNIVSDSSLLHDIHQVNRTLTVHCMLETQ